MGFLGFGKKKEESTQPVIPELPADLQSPSMDLAEPPKPSGSSMMPPEMPSSSKNNDDDVSMDVPELSAGAPVLQQEPPMLESTSAAESDDYNLDEFDLESNDFDVQKTGVIPGPNESFSIEDEVAEIPEKEEVNFKKIAKQVRAEHSGRTGPFYLRVENFKNIVDKTSEAKDAVDACLENGNDIINTNNSQIKNTTDRLQNTLQQVKKKLYLAGDILFK